MTYIKLVLTAVFWGGTFIAGRLLAGEVTPFCAAFLRFAIASFFLLILTYKLEGGLPRLSKKQIVGVILLGMTGVFSYNVLFFMGLNHIGAGRASLIIANNPIAISLLSALIFKESLGWIKGLGILLSVSGAVIVIAGGQTELAVGFGRGELYICGCVLSWVAYSLIGKAVMEGLSPLASVCCSAVVGAIALFVPAVGAGLFDQIGGYSARSWTALFYLGFFGTVLGFFWYYSGIKQIGPMKASVFINLVPVSAIFLAYFILGERLTPALFGGGLLVITGVYLTNSSAWMARKPETAKLIKQVKAS